MPGLRRTARVAVVLLAFGGIPGSFVGPGRSAGGPLAATEATRSPLPALPDGAAERDGAVDVTVRSSPDAGQLAGAHVRAFAIAEDRAVLVGAGETGPAGQIHLANLPRGETWVLADAPGHARGSTHFVLDGVRQVAIDLGPEHAIDVMVRDEDGHPVADAEVEAELGNDSGDPLPVGARTAADGLAHVGRLGPGPWHVSARARGFEEARGRAEAEGATLSLVLRKLGSIAAHIVAPDGTPAAGARVAVAGATLWPARVANADEHGDLRIGSLGAGTYALRATKGDAVSATELDVALGRGESQDVVLRLARGRFVGVRVTDGDANDAASIPAARVTLAEGGLSPFPLEGTTDRAGRARLGPIGAGGAALSVRADGFVPRGAVPVGDPAPAEIRVSLVRSGVLTGRVVDARGRPIDGASIAIVGTDAMGQPIYDDPRRSGFQAAHFEAMLGGPLALLPGGELGVVPGPVPPIPNALGIAAQTPAGGGAAATAVEPWVTRGDGTFRAAPASPGSVRVLVKHPEYVEAESDLVSLAPGREASVDVVMHQGGVLEGRVLDARERPVEHARVSVAAVRGSLARTTRTASDGSFAFAALPDAVVLTASATDGDSPDARLTFAIPEGGRKEVSIVLPEPRDPLPVSVVDDQGWPIDAAQVSASSVSVDGALRTTAFTDAHGDATLPRARGLALRVEVRAPGRAPRVVTTDGTEETLRVDLVPAEHAAGEVVADNGRDPIAGATVTVYGDLGPRRTRSDAQGAFAIAELAPGSARLDVRAPGFAPVTRTIQVPDSGGRRPFAMPRIEMAPEGTIEGDVVDPHGDPVAGARVSRDAVPTWLLVGSNPDMVAITDARGHFALHELPEGSVSLEAYAPGVGRGRVSGVKVVAGRTTDDVRVAIAAPDDDGTSASEPAAAGGVAVTLGETDAPTEVVVVSVVEGSEAERAGLVPGDVLVSVDGSGVNRMADARSKLGGPVGDDAVVAVRRGDRAVTLRVAREAVRR
jgi:protocatechuate 3,4-dioxygenase beta subunit